MPLWRGSWRQRTPTSASSTTSMKSMLKSRSWKSRLLRSRYEQSCHDLVMQCVITLGSVYISTFWCNMLVSLPASTSALSGKACQYPYQGVLRKCHCLLQKKTDNCEGHLDRLVFVNAGRLRNVQGISTAGVY